MVNLITHGPTWVLRSLAPLLTLLLLTACGSGSSQTLLVFAAASLAEPLSEIGERFSSETDVLVDFSFDGSGALAQRIRRGAPADLVIAAGAVPMDLLVGEGRIDAESRSSLLTNRLALISQTERETPLRSLEELATSAVGRIAIADPSLAPAGWYAKQALESLGLWQEVEAKMVPAASVRVALGYVETGVADAAIVYETDAALSQRVRTVLLLPQEGHPPIVYPVAVVRDADNADLAWRFVRFLQGREATEVFQSYGFTSVGEGAQVEGDQ